MNSLTEPYDEEKLEHQWPVCGISEWQESNDLAWHDWFVRRLQENGNRWRFSDLVVDDVRLDAIGD